MYRDAILSQIAIDYEAGVVWRVIRMQLTVSLKGWAHSSELD